MRLSVVAPDYDGTIAEHGALNPAIRRAIAGARERRRVRSGRVGPEAGHGDGGERDLGLGRTRRDRIEARFKHRPCRGLPGAAGVCLLLMLNLPLITWVRFIVWLGVGLVVCGTFGARHSRLNAPTRG